MNEYQKEMAFLTHILNFDDTDERRKFKERIEQVRASECCIQRVTAGTALCAVLAVVGVAYPAILEENFPYGASQVVVRVLCELALASMICLLGLLGLRTVYRKRMNRLREEGRRLVTRLLAEHVGKPDIATSQSRHLGVDDREGARATGGVNGSPCRFGTVREGVVHYANKTSPEENPFA